MNNGLQLLTTACSMMPDRDNMAANITPEIINSDEFEHIFEISEMLCNHEFLTNHMISFSKVYRYLVSKNMPNSVGNGNKFMDTLYLSFTKLKKIVPNYSIDTMLEINSEMIQDL